MVCIKPSTARFFLEAHDELLIRRGQNLNDSLRIANLDSAVSLLEYKVILYQTDSVVHNHETETLREEISFKDKDIRVQKKRTKLTTVIALILLGVLLVK